MNICIYIYNLYVCPLMSFVWKAMFGCMYERKKRYISTYANKQRDVYTCALRQQ